MNPPHTPPSTRPHSTINGQLYLFPPDCGSSGAGAGLPLPRGGGRAGRRRAPRPPGRAGHTGDHLPVLLHQPALRLRPAAAPQEGVGGTDEHPGRVQPDPGKWPRPQTNPNTTRRLVCVVGGSLAVSQTAKTPPIQAAIGGREASSHIWTAFRLGHSHSLS